VVVGEGREVVVGPTVLAAPEVVAGGVRDVTVNSRTSSNSGLDHARTWAPEKEWGLLAIRFRP
jgi:hypothetical protein